MAITQTVVHRASGIWGSLVRNSVAEPGQVLSYIDGLRGVAILMVVVYHLAQDLGGSAFRIDTLKQYIDLGDRGVQLFFILSAYTLFASSEKRFKTDRKPVFSFYIRRAFRILPFWWLMNIYWFAASGASLTQLVASSSFIFGFVRYLPGYELVPGGWSLFVEETFYIFLPLIFGYIRTLWRAAGVAIGLWFVSDLWLRFAPHIGVLNHDNAIFFAPFAQWYAFALGIMLFYLTLQPLMRRYVFDNTAVYFLLDTVAIAMLWVVLPMEYRLGTLALLALVIASVPNRTLVGRFVRIRILRRIGRYSYSLYLLHFVLLTTLAPLRNWIWQTTGTVEASAELKLLAYTPVFVLVLFVAGFISFNVIEKPCIDWGRKLNARINRSKVKPVTPAELTAL